MTVRIINADVFDGLAQLGDESVHHVCTSPPYWRLRDYGYDGQIGLEATPAEHVDVMVRVFREVRRVLRSDGTLMLNYGDMWAGSSGGGQGKNSALANREAAQRDVRKMTRTKIAGGLKPKDLVMMPERIALALQADGWWVRDRIIWHKPNPMPSSIKDRCTPSYEIVWQMSKSAHYHWNADAIAEPRVQAEDANGFHGGSYVGGKPGPRTTIGNKIVGKNEALGDRTRSGFNGRWDAAEAAGAALGTRNRRNVWTIATEPYKAAHFATMPSQLAKLCILAGCPPGGTVLDPFCGAGTTGLVADRLQRHAILIDASPVYIAEHIMPRIRSDAGLFADVCS